MLPPYVAPLIARARAGDGDALSQLWRELNPLLLRYLRGRVGMGADDVAAQTWLDATRGLNEFTGDDDDFRRWLFTIARRRLIDEFRRRDRRPEDPVWPPPAVAALADGGFDRTDDLASALRLVRELTPDQADAVLLRVVADLDVAQVAIVMGRSEGSVRVLVHRGLRRLQQILEERRVTDEDPTAMYREQ
jgi:RNA polymerase sigma-70 factor (ECF subfamily)